MWCLGTGPSLVQTLGLSLLTTAPGVSHLTLWGLSFLVCEMGLVRVLTKLMPVKHSRHCLAHETLLCKRGSYSFWRTPPPQGDSHRGVG